MTVSRLWPLLLPALAACQPSVKADSAAPVPAFKPPVVVDTSTAPRQPRRARWLATGNYPPLYVGRYQPRLRPDYRLAQAYYYLGDEDDGPNLYPAHLHPADSTRLQIVVDTTQRLTDYAQVWNRAASQFTDSVFTAYTVFLVNTSPDTLMVGGGSHLQLQLEARDPQGQWRPIEHPFLDACGNGVRNIWLLPGQLVLTAAPLQGGSYRTRLRLRHPWLGRKYGTTSAEFAGAIELSQFEKHYE